MPRTTAYVSGAAPGGAHRVARAAGIGAGVAMAVAGGAIAFGRAVRTAGATSREATAAMPGDELLPAADLVSTRAVTVAAPPGEVWPWLVQLGWGRAGWYSIDALERLVGAARSTDAAGRVSWRSVREIVPAHQHLTVGDRVPLEGDVGLTVAALEEPSHLVLELDRLVAGGRLRWVWCFALRPVDGGCRLVVRTRTAWSLPLVGGPVQHLVLDPGHAVMELVQLHGIRVRAEAAARWTVGVT